ncbi:MAG TPA: acylphosphatase [Casimicrobiaceae bacterium]|jgi:acylphosphatase
MSVVARRLVIRGHVQGVGYRYAMVGAARHAGVRGWVRNLRDGSVEAFVQGDGAAVLALVAWSERGPPGADVSAVDVVDAEPDDGLTGFETRRGD